MDKEIRGPLPLEGDVDAELLGIERQYAPEWYEDLQNDTDFQAHRMTDEQWEELEKRWGDN